MEKTSLKARPTDKQRTRQEQERLAGERWSTLTCWFFDSLDPWDSCCRRSCRRCRHALSSLLDVGQVCLFCAYPVQAWFKYLMRTHQSLLPGAATRTDREREKETRSVSPVLPHNRALNVVCVLPGRWAWLAPVRKQNGLSPRSAEFSFPRTRLVEDTRGLLPEYRWTISFIGISLQLRRRQRWRRWPMMMTMMRRERRQRGLNRWLPVLLTPFTFAPYRSSWKVRLRTKYSEISVIRSSSPYCLLYRSRWRRRDECGAMIASGTECRGFSLKGERWVCSYDRSFLRIRFTKMIYIISASRNRVNWLKRNFGCRVSGDLI